MENDNYETEYLPKDEINDINDDRELFFKEFGNRLTAAGDLAWQVGNAGGAEYVAWGNIEETLMIFFDSLPQYLPENDEGFLEADEDFEVDTYDDDPPLQG